VNPLILESCKTRNLCKASNIQIYLGTADSPTNVGMARRVNVCIVVVLN